MKGLVRLTLVALVLAGALAAPLLGGALAAPSPPKLPPLPTTVPGAEVARFKVVVEGEAASARQVSGEGNNGICGVELAGAKVNERMVYGRGKGVTMEALRFGKGKRSGVLVKRAGRKADASFLVRGTLERTADGIYERYVVNNAPCKPIRFELAKGDDCGVAFEETERFALIYDSGRGAVTVRQLGGLKGISKAEKCGRGPEGFGLLADLPYGWPGPTEPLSGQLPVGLLFGKKRAFKVELSAPPIDKRERTNQGGVALAISDQATHTATLRFVRLGD